MNKVFLLEACVVGIVTCIASYFFDTNNKAQCFIMGFLIHFIFEIIGANKYYCKHGNACKQT